MHAFRFLSLLSLFAVSALFSGCAAGRALADPSADVREIYRLLLEDQEVGHYGPILVLEDSVTQLRGQQIRDALESNPETFTAAELAIIANLLDGDRRAAPVPPDLGTRRPYEVGDSTSEAEAREVLFISGIGWSPARDRAVVHVDYFCEGCGWGGLTFFSRGAGGWRIEGRRWMWRS